MTIRLRTTLTSLLLCATLLSTAIAAETEPVPPAALPSMFLPLVTGGGNGIDLTIAGVEITQSTQTSSNSVPLVADRATVARVYAVSSGPAPVSGVTVSVAATRGGVPLPGSPVRAGPKSVAGSAARASYDASFNVLLPQSWLSGNVSLVATVDASGAVPETNEANNTAGASLSFGAVPPLDIKIVPVRYTHTPTGRTYPAPSRDTISQWVMRSYPFSEVRVSFRSPIDYAGNLGSTSGWEDLLDHVTTVKLADGAPAHQIYYALAPTQNGADRWFTGGVAGIGWVGMRAAVSLEFGPGQEEKTGRIAAHEIGHNLRRYHAPCGTSGDPRQPFPYAGASIGAEVFGLDIAYGRVWAPGAPDGAKDVMSYCTPQWVSDFTYTALYREQRASGAALAAAPGDVLLVRATLGEGGAATLLPVYALSGATPTAWGGEYLVELLDASGAVLARHPVELAVAETPHGFQDDHAAAVHHEPEGEHDTVRRVHALVPAPAVPVAALRLLHGDTILAMQDVALPQSKLAPLAEPAVTREADGTALLRWTPAGAPALVRGTAGGARWTTLGIDVQGGELRLDAAMLAGLQRVEVTPAGGAPLELALPKAAASNDAPPRTWIDGPAQARAGEPALLYGQAADDEDGALDALQWTVNGVPAEGGRTLQLGALAPGSYTVTLTGRDGAGQSASATHTLTVAP